VWHHPYFHHMVWVPVIAYSVIRKDFVTRIRLRTHLPIGCLRHAFLLHENFPGFITERNMQQIVIADRNIVYHFRTKCRALNTIMLCMLLKNIAICNTTVTMFPANLALECWLPCYHVLSSLSVVISVAVEHPEFFFAPETVTVHLLLVPSISGWSCTCLALSTFQVVSYLVYVQLSAIN
jgi:hypothetical protein